MPDLHPGIKSLLSFLRWEHLPEELAMVSRPFGMLANQLVQDWAGATRHPAELTACLRKLLEAKDCAVRAAIG